jgi:NAD(P)H-dependent flavin oxidoreductase YrpB (nitropropane dioxygenase family)
LASDASAEKGDLIPAEVDQLGSATDHREMSTRFTELVGCTHPVQLAGMGGGAAGPALAAAVRDAGGLGMVSYGEACPGGCGINLLMPFEGTASAVAEAARHTRIVELFYGQPDAVLVSTAHELGAIVGWQVGSGDEAAAAETAGCDYVVAQGTEAGGHVRGQEPLDVVLGEVLARVRLPVVAAGGIATPERVSDLLARGADGVRVGTRFLVCPESRAHQTYVENILAARADDTILTDWFDEGWPNAPHRVLRSAFEAARRSGWRSTQPPSRDTTRSPVDMAQYAGMGVDHITRVEPAEDVVRDLISQLPR